MSGETVGMRNPMAWWLAAVLAVVVLGGIGRLGLRLRPYWVAKYHGQGADLQGAVLQFAPLHRANLTGARLPRAVLRVLCFQGRAWPALTCGVLTCGEQTFTAPTSVTTRWATHPRGRPT